jgi:carbonic anhydrase
MSLAGVLAVGMLGGLTGARMLVKPPPEQSLDAAHAAAGEGHGEASVGEIWERLMDGNRRFAAGEPEPRELVDRREALAEGQHPRVIVVGCSDSRVSPELLFDQGLGDLFVIRTAGNVAGPVALGSIEYAVEHLHVRVLVVLGHEKCGAVAAAASGEKMPTPNLAAIVGKIAPALAKLKGRVKEEQLASEGIAANVRQSAQDLVSRSPVLRKEVQAGKLSIIKAVYRLKTGEVVRL